MPPNRPRILHFKWSLDDGHVTPQIFRVDPYQGILLTREPKKKWKNAPYNNQLCSFDQLLSNPKSVIQKYNIKAVHVHHATLANKLLFLKKKHGLPLIVGFRGKDATSYPKKKKHLKILKKVFKTADLFLPVCHHLKNKIIKLGCPKNKIKVMYGGVDLSRFQCTPRTFPKDGPVHFLAVGRFVEKKGFGDLIDAFSKVHAKYGNTRLTLIGQGEYEQKYRKKIKKHGLEKQVKLVSWVDYQKIQQVYQNAHIFCAPSCIDKEGNEEGIPNTLKEAMATGMPCIATRHAGIPEIMKDGVTGLLVKERNKKELAAAMERMLQSPQKWQEWGLQARKRIEAKFNQKKQLQKQKEFYDRLLR